MALFGRKKKDEEQGATGEQEALSTAETSEQPALGDNGGGSGGSFIPDASRTVAEEPSADEDDDTTDDSDDVEAEAESKPVAEAEPEPERSEPAAPPPAPSREPAPEGTPGGRTSMGGQSPLEAQRAGEQDDPFNERPEMFVGAAFVGGFLFAQLIKWMGDDDE